MIFRFNEVSFPMAVVLAGLMMGSGGCRKNRNATVEGPAPRVEIAELESNGLASLPGAVYRSQAGSPIHWQPWTQETMARAKTANRLVFAVVAMPQQPGFASVLDALSKDPAVVSQINDRYVPVLIDGEASREIGLLVGDLCAEIRQGVQLPLFLWLSPDGNPVGWLPVPRARLGQVTELYRDADEKVRRDWSEDPDYVIDNSARDNAARRERIGLRKNTNVTSKQPAEDAVRGVRQLASFYDPDLRSFDRAGGLFPSGSLDLLATAAIHPGLPAEVREKCLATTRELLIDLLSSPMFDPLDGGLFNGRRGKTWSFPSYSRDCISQARAMVALLNAHRATGNPAALAKALELIAFAEKSYQTSEGLFSAGLTPESEPAAWLWSVEEIRKELPAEDAAWWIKATGMTELGNLPFESDMRRDFFRANSIGLGKSMAQIAADLSLPVDTFAPRFEIVRQTLLRIREKRLTQPVRDDSSHAGATFRMVSAYATAFAATGDNRFREKSVALLEKCRTAFVSGHKLRMFSQDAPKSVGEGRAFLYALALQAALDVSTITSDGKWLVWSEDLATTAAELFTDKEFLKECPDEARIINLPITDLVMLFDDSTAGVLSLDECRLAKRERPLVASFSDLATPLPYYIVDRPILHTDLVQATIAREFSVTVLVPDDVSPGLRLSIERLPVRMIQRRPAKSSDAVPAGSVKILFGSGESRVVSSAGELQEALLPSVTKS